MPDRSVDRAKKEGLPPGTPVYTGDAPAESASVRVVAYDRDGIDVHDAMTPKQAAAMRGQRQIVWADIVGLHDVQTISEVCRRFDVHPLAIEDIVNPGSRPKLDEYARFLFVIAKILHLEDRTTLRTEQVSIVIGGDFVLTFQEQAGDPFDRLRERIRNGVGRVRTDGTDYLAYCLLDAIVDHYLVVLEELGEGVEALEDTLLVDVPPNAMQQIQELRTAALVARRAVSPLREALSTLRASRSPIVDSDTQPYLADLYDHVQQAMDSIELYRDMIMGLIGLYHTGVSTKLNDTMKVLTVISTIFIPLSFIAGCYGMNFAYMPELKWWPSYFVVLGMMGTLALLMTIYFKVKRWF